MEWSTDKDAVPAATGSNLNPLKDDVLHPYGKLGEHLPTDREDAHDMIWNGEEILFPGDDPNLDSNSNTGDRNPLLMRATYVSDRDPSDTASAATRDLEQTGTDTDGSFTQRFLSSAPTSSTDPFSPLLSTFNTAGDGILDWFSVLNDSRTVLQRHLLHKLALRKSEHERPLLKMVQSAHASRA